MRPSAIDLAADAHMLTAMKSSLTVLCLILFAWTVPLAAQQVDQAAVIPAEVSEPPYAVGDRVVPQGHYIPVRDGLSLNFRIVGNQVRIYWIDAAGLVAEPQAAGGSVRLRGPVRGRDFLRVARLSDDAGLGSPGLVLPPHSFFVVLNLERPEGEGLDHYTFRYVPAMARPVDAAEPNRSQRN
jgi:hypothetical protein